MLECTDANGRRVELSASRWRHIVRRHPYIRVTPEVVIEAVVRPDAHLPGRRPGEEWFYRRDVGPSSWIKVVVHFEHGRGVIKTAFPRRSLP